MVLSTPHGYSDNIEGVYNDRYVYRYPQGGIYYGASKLKSQHHYIIFIRYRTLDVHVHRSLAAEDLYCIGQFCYISQLT